MSCLKVQVIINSGMCQNAILVHLFFSNSIVSLMMFFVRLLSELMTLLSTHLVINHRTRGNKSKLMENISISHQLLFDFEVSRFGT